ncbi:MAG: hypothetical protein H0X36_12995 [Sphingomonadaceae bacterium]|nr:hypothetical protein [Sphingomonadaceae bacterium]
MPIDFDSVYASALIDTGSTTSGLTPRITHRLGLVGLGKRPLGSAQGFGQAERFAFRVALRPDDSEAPAFPFVFDRVIGFESESFQLDALIGMDILSQCEFWMARNGLCRVEFG